MRASQHSFYRQYYQYVLIACLGLLVLLIGAMMLVLNQMYNRPLPKFSAVQSTHQTMRLTPFLEPNLLPNTLLQWAAKAATAAYTFDFVNYNAEIAAVRPYFTDKGWRDYQTSVSSLVKNIVQNQLLVNGVVDGAPVIANQGPLPGQGYVWRVEIPFLVTYQNGNAVAQQKYYVVLTIVRISTDINPQGIGIDQFVMV